MKRPVFDALMRAKKLKGVAVLGGIQGTPTGDRDITEMVEIAGAHEYGSGVPMRAFLRGASATERKAWLARFRRAVRAHVRGNETEVEEHLRLLAQMMVSGIQTSIRDGEWTPNTQKTIDAKGSDRPLIDTTQMIQSIRGAVEYRARTQVVA